MRRVGLWQCLVSIALGCAVMVCGPSAAPTAELPNIFQIFSTPKAQTPRTSVCERPRRSVVRKPPKTAPCPECPPPVTQSCANCPCDLTQLIEQITINDTTNTTKLENSLKVGFDKLFDATVKLPDIIAGLAILQTNIKLLSDISADLQLVRSSTTQISDDQSKVITRLGEVIQSLTAANGQLTAIGGFTATLPGILSALNLIQTDVKQIAERLVPDPRLAVIIAQLEAIEKNTRSRDVLLPPRLPPQKDAPEPTDPILSCMRKGHVYFMGPLDAAQRISRCMTQDSWDAAVRPYSWTSQSQLLGSLDQRTQWCQEPPGRRFRVDGARLKGAGLFAEDIAWLLSEAKDAKLPRGIRLVGAVIYDPLSIADLETSVPLAIEYATFCSEVHFTNLNISRELSFDGSVFLKDLTFANSNLGENLHIRKALTRKVSFPSTTVNGEIDLSETVAARVWSFVGAIVGQVAATKADLRDLDMTDIEIKRRFSADGIRIRNTFLLQGKVGSDIDLANARLTHTTIRRSTVQSDLRLKNVDARCSTKIHKSKIEGDVIIEEYRFGAVEPEKLGTSADQPIDGKFRWALKPSQPSPIELPEETLKRLYQIDKPKENDGDEAQQIDSSACAIITPKKDDKPEYIYRSSGVLDLVDLSIGGSVCVSDLNWQRGLQQRLRTRSTDGKNFDPQNVLSFNGTSVAKYTILGLLEHPKEPPEQKKNAERSEYARLQLIGFKTNGLMLQIFRTSDEYRKVVSQLDVQVLLKAQAGCPLDDIGFSRVKARPIGLAGFFDHDAEESKTPSPDAPQRTTERVAGADFPKDSEILDWLTDVDPQTSQPHAVFIAALTKSGLDPVELRIAKSWLDLKNDRRTWFVDSWSPTNNHQFRYLSVANDKVVDLAQIGVRNVHGLVSGFGLRPARSLVLTVIFITLIWLILRVYHGRIAFLAADATLVKPDAHYQIDLSVFDGRTFEWQTISWPVVLKMMIPHALTSVPLLGGAFGSITFDWSKNSIIGFRRAKDISKGKEAVRWKELTAEERTWPVTVPHDAPTFSYLEVKLNEGLQQVRDLRGQGPARQQSQTHADPEAYYLPGLIEMPQSGRLLASLQRWSRLSLIAAAILVSGIVALFKF